MTSTCQAICQVLRFEPPRTVNEWLKISHYFEELWNFPHCLGSIDGKHVAIQAPPKCGSEYYNYKKFNSIVLLAVCDAKYKFTIIDIGDSGSHSDGGVFANSCFGRALNKNQFPLPPPSPIINGTESLPYCFVADEAFPLKTNLMRPYPGHQLPDDKKIFNYRLSRARRIIENAFGILTARWRIFKRPINSTIENAKLYTNTACVLHNFLQNNYAEKYCPPSLVDSEKGGEITSGSWRGECTSNFTPIQQTASNNYSRNAEKVRDQFKNYFTSPNGEVPWQLQVVNRI